MLIAYKVGEERKREKREMYLWLKKVFYGYEW